MDEKEFRNEDTGKLLFFNEAVEYMKKYEYIDQTRIQYEKEGSSSDENVDFPSENCLRNEMLEELNRLKELILNNPDRKLNKLSKDERTLFNRFIGFYKFCPVCGNYNHYHNLKTIYFNEELSEFKIFLIDYMTEKIDNRKLSKFNINIGVLCCNCYKTLYEQDE
ncbi:MAG: hypothetical protein BAJALOKI3v1_190030 [Promethearchaeota archaeon]|nr:MAG: hypothetical protein BAJALOKI3v1_190030 [Candidatus Lokiarchaeota archaeon]